ARTAPATAQPGATPAPVVLAASPVVPQPATSPLQRAVTDALAAVDPAQGAAAAPVPTAVVAPAPATVTATAPAVPVTSTPPAPLPLTNPTAFAAGLAGRLEHLPPATDAVHRLTVEVNPVGLGPVQVSAEVLDGALHVQLSAASELARHALRQAAGELQRELASTNFASTSVDVRGDAQPGQQHSRAAADAGQGGSQQRSGQQGQQSGPGGDRRALFAADEQRASRRSASAAARGGLDLQV
ncbi:flagellar hook-length control protein FliK, partial [Kineococcus glutinatus]|uniref:flagellar hook-length control protein FliK n=1 Tax=Kineococcus glutinatus TaxID=1070872 RepID=UPI0031EBD274